MKVLHEPDDPHMLETLLYLAQHSTEGMQSNMRINVGKVTLSCTGNTLCQVVVTFKDALGKNNKPFLAGTTPFVLVSLSSPSYTVTPPVISTTKETNTGFTAQAFSSSTQTLTVVYLAIGQTG